MISCQYEENIEEQMEIKQKLHFFHKKNAQFKFMNHLDKNINANNSKKNYTKKLYRSNQDSILHNIKNTTFTMKSLPKTDSYYQNYDSFESSFDSLSKLKSTKLSQRKKGIIQKNISENITLQGQGIVRLQNGQTVFGTWKNNAIIGNVKIVYPSGKIYVGETIDYMRHGKGALTFKNGWIYEGNFAYGHREGRGVLKDKDGMIVNNGRWTNGNFVDPISQI